MPGSFSRKNGIVYETFIGTREYREVTVKMSLSWKPFLVKFICLFSLFLQGKQVWKKGSLYEIFKHVGRCFIGISKHREEPGCRAAEYF